MAATLQTPLTVDRPPTRRPRSNQVGVDDDKGSLREGTLSGSWASP